MRRIVIVQEHVPHYRVSFYNRLRDELKYQGVELELYYSPENSIAAVPGHLPWAHKVKTRKLWRFVWQPVFGKVRKADAVILVQESKYLLNYLLYGYRCISGLRVALWGHGRSFQSEGGLGESMKAFFSKHVDWWFAYNERSKQVVKDLGFPNDRITAVMNTIDTAVIESAIRDTSDVELSNLKHELGIDSDNVAIFTGRFFAVKRPIFLLQACERIRARVPDFQMIFIGNGGTEQLITEAAKKYDWVHAVGAKNDVEKVPYWMLSKLALMPGAVGLTMVDSLLFGVPLVTTSVTTHGPEIDYLVNGRNGVIVDGNPDDVEAYVMAAVDLLQSREALASMRQCCIEDADGYSMENMVERFTTGVKQLLDVKR